MFPYNPLTANLAFLYNSYTAYLAFYRPRSSDQISEMMWSSVCLVAPHSQCKDEARPYLCIDKQKRPKSESSRLSLNRSRPTPGNPIPISLVLTMGMKTRITNTLLEHSTFYFVFVYRGVPMLISSKLSNNFQGSRHKWALKF